MALTVQLSELRDRVREAADMENDTFVSDAEINGHINRMARRLYSEMVSRGYMPTKLTSSELTGSSPYTLPTDLLRLHRVYLLSTSNTGAQLDIRAFPDRVFVGGRKESSGSRSVYVEYIPRLTDMSLDADTFDGADGWDDWIVLRAALRLKSKDNDDRSQLREEYMMLDREIKEDMCMYDRGPTEFSVRSRGGLSGMFYAIDGTNLRVYGEHYE